MTTTVVRSERRTPGPTLGLGANWRQFALLVAVNAFVGGMVGMERSILPLLVDVREPNEFAVSHVEGAVNIPLGSLKKAIESVPHGTPTIAYCGHGERSTTAISVLERRGVEAVNLEGGFPGDE